MQTESNFPTKIMLSPPRPRRLIIPIPGESRTSVRNVNNSTAVAQLPEKTPGPQPNTGGADKPSESVPRDNRGLNPSSQIGECSVPDFESRVADQAVDDLPGVFTEVFSMQRNQSNEINKQRQVIAFLKGQLMEGEDKNNEIELEIKCVMNKIYMKEEWIKDANKRQKHLQTDISSMLRREVERQMAVREAEEELNITRQKFKQHYDKMKLHTEAVTECEQGQSPVYEELSRVREHLEQLQAKQALLEEDPENIRRTLSGEAEQALVTEIDELKNKLGQLDAENKCTRDKVLVERNKQAQISQTVKVLKKRNAAQLIRLKRQLKELQSRNRLKELQVKQFRENIHQVELKLLE